MAKITISGLEDKKTPVTPVTPTTQGTNSGAGSSGTSSGGSGTNSGTTGNRPTQSYKPSGTSGSFLSTLLGNMNLPWGNQNTQTDIETNEERAETAISDLRNKYAQNLRNEYDYSAEKLKNERDAALRENWILQQRAEAALPEQMAASGINGGASETSLADLRARYQGNRNDIQGNYMENLGDLTQQAQSEKAENERNLNERWIEYLLSLAKANAGV